MEVTEYTKPMTVEMLLDAVKSQYLLWGDRQLVVRPEITDVSGEFELFVANSTLLCCLDDNEMRDEGSTLASLIKCLEDLPPEPVIRVIHDISPDFKVGFDTEDGFIEVINYSEVYKANK